MIPLQATSSGPVRSASLLNFVQGVLPRHAAPPTAQSQPYWVESTLSLLPPIPPSTSNATTSIAAVSDVDTQNPRTSLYRKAVHTHASNADLCCSIRLDKRRNPLAVDTAPVSRTTLRRPQSAYTPFLHPMGSGEACTSPVVNLGIVCRFTSHDLLELCFILCLCLCMIIYGTSAWPYILLTGYFFRNLW